MLSIESQQKIEQLLVQGGQLAKADLEAYKVQALQANTPLLTYLNDKQLVADEELAKVEAQALGMPYVNLSGVQVKDEFLRLLSKDVARNYMAVPFGTMQGRLAVAMLDPTNVQAVDFIARKTSQPITTFMASRASIERVLGLYRADLEQDVSAAISSVDTEELKILSRDKSNPQKLQNLVQDAPITRALNAILDYAIQSRASDIHVEPREKELKIRYRIDGILQDTMTLPKSIEPALISRIKILSNLKIDEHRVPQDGQYQIRGEGKNVDLRIAIAPITYGEQVVIRLLNKNDVVLTLEALGFRGRARRMIEDGIHRPHGMTLSTGPTGSGKTTTMYAIIQGIKDVAINIITLEDPVEYKIDGVNQMQVNNDVGLTFAGGLRSILRQDPNVIMVGEIRDKETADLAVQAALTGHVVLSTLHTNSAAGVLPRMLDMNIEPFLIASTVNTCIGQRLVRKLCDKCREESKTSEAETASINKTLGSLLAKTKGDQASVAKDLGFEDLPLADQSAYTLYKPKGCNQCVGGYMGRLGIYEAFAMSDAMEKLLVKHATTSEVQKQAEADGMVTMKQDGYLKVLTGLTSLEEVARVAADF